MKYDVIIVASGKGQRANLGYNKAFYKMKNGKTVLENSASLFIKDIECQKIIVVTNQEYFIDVFKNEKVELVQGGKERKDSVYNGLQKVTSPYVLIHDAARPFLQKEALEQLKETIEKTDAAILAKKAIDTIKYVKDNVIEKTIDRDYIYMAETPQGFKSELIRKCYDASKGVLFTDDASLLEAHGYKVNIVVDEYNNKKLTKEEDFINL